MTGAAALIEEARQLLIGGAADADTLYACWFHRQSGGNRDWPDEGGYRAAMLDARRFERGWRVRRASDGRMGAVVSVRGRRERTVAPPEMVPEEAGRLSPGGGDALLVDPLAAGVSGGFWHIWSAGWQHAPPKRLTRIYFNLDPAQALRFAADVARAGPPQTRWAAKLLCGPHECGRRDGALIYLPLSRGVGRGWVADFIASARPWCVGDLPPFVTPLAEGVGRARDPGADQSFGQALCGALWSHRALAGDHDAFHSAALQATRKLGGTAE